MVKIRKINFKRIDNDALSVVESTDEKYILLDYFVGHYRDTSFLQNDIIEPLELILRNEKTFSEITEGQLEWSYADDYCIFEVEDKTAFFVNEKNSSQNLEMPLKEVVDYLKEWKAFLESN